MFTNEIIHRNIFNVPVFQKAMQFMNETYNYCIQNELKLDRDDVCDLMESVLDEDFNTICEDNSTREISLLLVKYLKMCRENRLAEIEAELSQLPPLKERWLQVGHAVQYASRMDDDSSSDDEDDDQDPMNNGVRVRDLTEPAMPSSSGSTMEVMEEDAEWTVVKTKNKRK